MAGGGFGGIVGAAVVAVLTHFHIHVSDTDASIIGAAAVSVGVGLGHVVAKGGVKGAVKALWEGSRAAS